MSGQPESSPASRSLDAVLAFEDSRHPLLFETFAATDWHSWPSIRWPLVTGAIEAELSTRSPGAGSGGIRSLARDVAAGLNVGRQALRRMPRERRRFLFIVGGVTVRPTPQGEENWLVDDYARARAAESVIVTDAVRPGGRAHKTSFPDTYTTSAALVRSELTSRFSRRRTARVDAARQAVDAMIAALEPHLPVKIPAYARTNAINRLVRAQSRQEILMRVVDRIQPELVLVEDASYGSRAPSVEWLTRQGVVVAEPQHGWIGPAHGAYNFGAAMFDDGLRAAMPAQLLLFGRYWGRSLRHPARQIVIGKPYLDTAVERAPHGSERPPRAVVISSMYRRDEAMRLTLRLRDLLPADWRIDFRPHPSERRTVAGLYPLLVDEPRIGFDTVPDVYESIGRSRIVVGTASTVLYEALSFDVDVVVIDSPLTPMYAPRDVFGPPVAGDEELERVIADILAGRRERPPVDRDLIWAPHARESAAAYIESGWRSESTSAAEG